MKFQLVAKINDPDLLGKSVHELGTVFYQEDNEGNIIKVAYFSGSRVIEYNGKVDETLAKRIRAEGHAVDLIEIDEFQSSVRIIQNKPPKHVS
jgi:hypothetical protein